MSGQPSYTETIKLELQLADIQSQLTQRTAELNEIEKIVDIDSGKTLIEKVRDLKHSFKQVYDSYQDAANEMFKAQDERTAELEAVSNFIGVKYDAESKTWVSGQAPYLSAGTTKQEACIAAVDALRLACATWETKYRDLQAELERVRADNKALDEWRADVTVSLQRPGGAFFVDVPQHIKDLVKERDALRAQLAAAQKVKADYDRWLSGGVYFTTAEYEKHIAEHQAQLRQVEGERDHAKKMEAVQKEVADNQTWHVQKLRTLILALPKVEGEIQVIEAATDEWHVYDAIFTTQAGADNYAAMLQERQKLC